MFNVLALQKIEKENDGEVHAMVPQSMLSLLC